jgi:hypothetical protein
LTSLLGSTEDEALEICRLAGVHSSVQRIYAPRPFDGDVWRVVQERQSMHGILLVVAAFKSQPEEPR